LVPAAAVALAVGTLPSVEAASYSSLVVFGDSLSDNGNNALAGLYDPAQVVTGNTYVPGSTYAPAMTYTNGPVWASYFASLLGVPLVPSLAGGTDFAFGGATTGTPGSGPGGFPYSLLTQTTQYLTATGNVASPSALYVVAGGGNNARAALGAVAGGAKAAATAAATAASFAADVGSIVDQLQTAGATQIVVWNTPNIGLTPAVGAAGGAAFGSFLAGTMNAALATRLAGEAGVSIFDAYAFGTALAANPGAFGFTNVTDACGAVAGADCSKYAYWDGIHPTTAVHLAVANALVTAIPEPETYALFALGLAVVAWRGKARAGAGRKLSAPATR
jgi:outer membrane lipase/esterase